MLNIHMLLVYICAKFHRNPSKFDRDIPLTRYLCHCNSFVADLSDQRNMTLLSCDIVYTQCYKHSQTNKHWKSINTSSPEARCPQSTMCALSNVQLDNILHLIDSKHSAHQTSSITGHHISTIPRACSKYRPH